MRPLLFALSLMAILAPRGASAESLPPAEQWVPAEALIVLQVHEPAALLDLVLRPGLLQAVSGSPQYRQMASQTNYQQFLALVAHLETRFGTDWQTALRKLIGGGVTLAVGLDASNLLIIDAEDPQMLEELHEVAQFIAKSEAAKKGQPARLASADYRGVTGWTFGDNEAHAIIGKRLLLTSNPKALKAALDLRADPAGRNIAAAPAYQAARKAAGQGAALTLYVNTTALKSLPQLAKLLESGQNPLATLLFAPVLESLRQSSWLGLGLRLEGTRVRLAAAVNGRSAADGPARFAVPTPTGQGAIDSPVVPRRIAALSLYRDLHGFYAAKDELFAQRTSELILFENMMGIFFTGRDLTEEVMGELDSHVQFVVAAQAYDPAVGTPATQLPAFAAIFQMRDPAHFAPVVEEAWQKALGLVNFTRGQKAEPGLIIDRTIHNGTKYTVAGFAATASDDKTQLDARFNFRPTLAMPGKHVILSSTETLARDLIDALTGSPKTEPLANVHSRFEMAPAQLASLLAVNRESLIRKNMLDEGNSREKAETEIDLLLTLARRVQRIELGLRSEGDQTHGALEFELDLP